MKLKTRTQLEASFKNGMRPSQTDFAELITSTLNKRDDQFLGRWKAGTIYHTGDIVVYVRALWEMTDDGGGEPRELCSHVPPSSDSEDWHSLVIPVEDDDWFVVDLEIPGTETVDEDLPPATMHANPRILRIGIGTTEPDALLDVLDEGRARLLFAGCERPGSVLRLVRLDEESAQHYLAAWVERYASLVTNAPEGFAFRSGDEHEDFCSHMESVHERPIVVMKRDGRVGIGTENPRTRLEVTNEVSGKFLFNLDCKVNPALSIVNLRPGTREHYLATGVDNDVAVFSTDSDYGFLFRAGGEYGIDEHELDINQGRELVSILPDGNGKLGIGRQPGDFQLDTNGLGRVYSLYVDTDERNLGSVENLGPVIQKLCQLRAVTFEWTASTELDDPGRKIGFVSHEVEEIFPQVVKRNQDRTKSVAYHMLVPVLVKAVDEQQSIIEGMQARMEELETRLAAIEGNTEEGI